MVNNEMSEDMLGEAGDLIADYNDADSSANGPLSALSKAAPSPSPGKEPPIESTSTADESIRLSPTSLYCSVPLNRDVQSIIDTFPKTEAEKSFKKTRKLPCLYCDRTFVADNLRQKHVERSHSIKQARRSSSRFQQSATSITCLYCDKFAVTTENGLDDLFVHLVRSHHSKYFGCLECHERFTLLSQLDEHNEESHEIKRELKVQSVDKTSDKNNSAISVIGTTKNRHKVKIKVESDQARPNLRRIKQQVVQRDIKNKRIALKSTKLGIKRSTRLQTKVIPVKSKKKKKQKPKERIQDPKEETVTETSIENPYPTFDAFYRVKKITDHSIDNLRISSLTFSDVFDQAFFTRITCNIRENLLNHLDGKLFNNEESESRISNFEKTQPEISNNDNYGCDLSINAATPMTTSLLTTQFGDDPEYQIEYGSKASKKKTTTKQDEVHYKYFTRRKYQASILECKENRDLSKLDMWTQFHIKNRQQKMLEIKKSDKEKLDYKKGMEYRAKIQNDELNKILDRRGPFEDLKEETTKKAALEGNFNTEVQNEVSCILEDVLGNVFGKISDNVEIKTELTDSEIPSYLNLRKASLSNDSHIDKSDRITLICSSQETDNFEAPQTSPRDKNALEELTGEWARSRLYICAACGLKMPNIKLLIDHKNIVHQNVWCQHYEFVGNQGEFYKHLSIPGLGKMEHVENNTHKLWRRSEARVCTKCKKQCNSLGELHRHILECGEDWSWMLVRKKLKYKPFGAKTRKKRRGLFKRIIQKDKASDEHKEKKTYIPRPKPSDAETIERMLANLPAKRATRKIMSLKDGFPKKSAMKSKMSNSNIQQNKMINKRNMKMHIRRSRAEMLIQESNQIMKGKMLKSTGLKCNPASSIRKSVRNLNKVISSKLIDNNGTALMLKRKLKNALTQQRITRRSLQVLDEVKDDEEEEEVVEDITVPEIKEKRGILKKVQNLRKSIMKKKPKDVVNEIVPEDVVNPDVTVRKTRSGTNLSTETENDAPLSENIPTVVSTKKTGKSTVGSKIMRTLSLRKKVKTDVEQPEAVQSEVTSDATDVTKNTGKRKSKFQAIKNVVKKMKLTKKTSSIAENLKNASSIVGDHFLEKGSTDTITKPLVDATASDVEVISKDSDSKAVWEECKYSSNAISNTNDVSEMMINVGSEYPECEKGFDSQGIDDTSKTDIACAYVSTPDIETVVTATESSGEDLARKVIEKAAIPKAKLCKRNKGLNACIAMLTNKLQLIESGVVVEPPKMKLPVIAASVHSTTVGKPKPFIPFIIKKEVEDPVEETIIQEPLNLMMNERCNEKVLVSEAATTVVSDFTAVPVIETAEMVQMEEKSLLVTPLPTEYDDISNDKISEQMTTKANDISYERLVKVSEPLASGEIRKDFEDISNEPIGEEVRRYESFDEELSQNDVLAGNLVETPIPTMPSLPTVSESDCDNASSELLVNQIHEVNVSSELVEPDFVQSSCKFNSSEPLLTDESQNASDSSPKVSLVEEELPNVEEKVSEDPLVELLCTEKPLVEKPCMDEALVEKQSSEEPFVGKLSPEVINEVNNEPFQKEIPLKVYNNILNIPLVARPLFDNIVSEFEDDNTSKLLESEEKIKPPLLTKEVKGKDSKKQNKIGAARSRVKKSKKSKVVEKKSSAKVQSQDLPETFNDAIIKEDRDGQVVNSINKIGQRRVVPKRKTKEKVINYDESQIIVTSEIIPKVPKKVKELSVILEEPLENVTSPSTPYLRNQRMLPPSSSMSRPISPSLDTRPLTPLDTLPLIPSDTVPLTLEGTAPPTPSETVPLTLEDTAPLTPSETVPLTPSETVPLTPSDTVPLTPSDTTPPSSSFDPSPISSFATLPTSSSFEVSPFSLDVLPPSLISKSLPTSSFEAPLPSLDVVPPSLISKSLPSSLDVLPSALLSTSLPIYRPQSPLSDHVLNTSLPSSYPSATLAQSPLCDSLESSNPVDIQSANVPDINELALESHQEDETPSKEINTSDIPSSIPLSDESISNVDNSASISDIFLTDLEISNNENLTPNKIELDQPKKHMSCALDEYSYLETHFDEIEATPIKPTKSKKCKTTKKANKATKQPKSTSETSDEPDVLENKCITPIEKYTEISTNNVHTPDLVDDSDDDVPLAVLKKTFVETPIAMEDNLLKTTELVEAENSSTAYLDVHNQSSDMKQADIFDPITPNQSLPIYNLLTSLDINNVSKKHKKKKSKKKKHKHNPLVLTGKESNDDMPLIALVDKNITSKNSSKTRKKDKLRNMDKFLDTIFSEIEGLRKDDFDFLGPKSRKKNKKRKSSDYQPDASFEEIMNISNVPNGIRSVEKVGESFQSDAVSGHAFMMNGIRKDDDGLIKTQSDKFDERVTSLSDNDMEESDSVLIEQIQRKDEDSTRQHISDLENQKHDDSLTENNVDSSQPIDSSEEINTNILNLTVSIADSSNLSPEDLQTPTKTQTEEKPNDSYIQTPDLNESLCDKLAKNLNTKNVKRTKTGKFSKKSRHGKTEPGSNYCELCDRHFVRTDSLVKHKRTLTHIAKLSEIEAKEAEEKAAKLKEQAQPEILEKNDGFDEPLVDDKMNEEPSTEKDISQSMIVTSPFTLNTNNDTSKLVDIINDVLNKPVTTENLESFNDILDQKQETKRYKSLGERKSFDSDSIIYNPPKPNFNTNMIENKITNSTDAFLQKQISLLENMIEENEKASFQYMDEISVNSNKSDERCPSDMSLVSDIKQDESNIISFSHNTNIVNSLMQSESDFVKPTQYEEISEDSMTTRTFDDQRSRKVLNRDEELFLECCSLLKSSSEVSNFSKQSRTMSMINNYGFKPDEEPEWLERKTFSAKYKNNGKVQEFLSEESCRNTPIGDNFEDFSNSDTIKTDWNTKMKEREFEDISVDSVTHNSANHASFNKFNVNFNDEKSNMSDASKFSGMDGKASDSVLENDIGMDFQKEADDAQQDVISIRSDEDTNSKSSIKQKSSPEATQTSITDYAVPLSNPLEICNDSAAIDKKMLTKGAMKVFEGLKVSIPTEDLDMNEVLNCSPTSKRVEAVDGDKEEIVLKPIKAKPKNNLKKFGNKLGLKITKKRSKPLKQQQNDAKVMEDENKIHDIYDFEETQDNTDLFSPNNLRSFRTQVPEKPKDLEVIETPQNEQSRDIESDGDTNNHDADLNFEAQSVSSFSTETESTTSMKKTSGIKNITKKKCVIMGRIFKNAFKSKSDEIKDIPTLDNTKLVENYVLNCPNTSNPSVKNISVDRMKMTEKEMDLLFDQLLEETGGKTKTQQKLTNRKEEIKLVKQKGLKQKKRVRKPSISSDDEFNLTKVPKKKFTRKKGKEQDAGINLEQELKECMGVAGRKSQRKCTSGKQNVLVEVWSSDSDSDFETVMQLSLETAAKEAHIEPTPPLPPPPPPIEKIHKEVIVNIVTEVKIVEPLLEAVKETPPIIVEKKEVKPKPHRKSMPKSKITNKLPRMRPPATETLASNRRKRAAADTLYYWSSSSDDDSQNLIEVKSVRDDGEDDDDRPMQHGWIVGDSPKKLVTMLAQAKGKKVDAKCVKEQSKKRTSI